MRSVSPSVADLNPSGDSSAMRCLAVVMAALLALAVARPALAQSVKKTPPAFEEVAPILARRCLSCHSGDHPKGKLDLTTRSGMSTGGKHGPAVVVGKPMESLLWKYVEQGRMPPRRSLPESEKAFLRQWIAEGAVW